jgi:hypothetical protein
MQAITLTEPPHTRHVSMSISSGPAVDPSDPLPLVSLPDSYARHPTPTVLALQKADHALSNGMGKLGEFVVGRRLDSAKQRR